GGRHVSLGGHHAPSGFELDGTSGAQRHDAGHRIPERLSIPAARSRPEVLPRVPGNPGSGRCEVYANPRSKFESHAERWVRSIKEECLSKLILLGESPLRSVVSDFLEHYHQERNHQGKDNLLLFPVSAPRTPGPQKPNPLSRAARRLTQVLQLRRMSILAK